MKIHLSLKPRQIHAILVLGVIAAGVAFRLYPVVHYPVFEAAKKAEIVVYTKVRNMLRETVDTKYSHVDEIERNEFLKSSFKTVISLRRDMIRETKKDLTWKLLRDRDNTIFLMAADPYYYFNLTRNLIATGRIAEKIRGLEYFNEKMLAPDGFWYPLDLHPYTGYLLYKIVSLFRPGISLMATLSWVPIILSIFAGLLGFVLFRRVLNLSWMASSLGTLYLLLSPIYIKRSLIGFYDTDSYNILFPLGLFILLSTALLKKITPKKQTVLFFSSALLVIGYALFWRGWIMPHLFLAASLAGLAVLHFFKRITPIPKDRLPYLVLLYAAIPLILISLLAGQTAMGSAASKSTELAQQFFSSKIQPWPDVFITVGELRGLNFERMAKILGGLSFLGLAITGLIWQIIFLFRKRDFSSSAPHILIIFFFLFACLVSARAERFALFLVLPTAWGCAVLIERLAAWLVNVNFGIFKEHRNITLIKTPFQRTAIFLVFVGCLFGQTHTAIRFHHPIYNSAWDKAMSAIRNSTPQDSIITSWWSPGHFITSMAQRRVTFDGATQNTPQAYWVANLFLERSEKKALGLLRMLNTSGNQAVEFLEDKGFDLPESIQLIHKLVPLTREEALKRIPNPELNKLIDLTHGTQDLPPSYLMVYTGMAQKAMALEFIGRWDFKKADRFIRFAEKHPNRVDKKTLGRATPKNIRLRWSFAGGGPSMQDEAAHESARDGSRVRFTNGLEVDLAAMDAEIKSTKYGTGKPQSILFMKDGKLLEKKIQGADKPFSVLLIAKESASKDGLVYQAVLGNPKLLRSFLFRLYYLGGEGLKHIKPFAQTDNPVAQTKVMVFEVVW